MDNLKLHQRNFIFLLFEGTFFFICLYFMDVNSIVPVFIDTYHGNLKLAGLAATLKGAAFLLPQILIGPYFNSIKNLPRFIASIALILRTLPLIMLPIYLVISILKQ